MSKKITPTGESRKLIFILRKRLGLTQKQLAEVAGISRISIARCELGISFPSQSSMKKIIDLAKKHDINVTFEDFYEKEEDDC